MLRLGLCCIFQNEPIKFRVITVANISKLENPIEKLSELVLHNVNSLYLAINYCDDHNIGCFRINSRLFPLYTHYKYGYCLKDLGDYRQINDVLGHCKDFAHKKNIRLTLHPDQFVVLNSPVEKVVENSIAELEYHAILAEHVGADVINIHAGGVYGNKQEALIRLEQNLSRLSRRVLNRLTLENDDKSYTPQDLYEFCTTKKVPLVYDIHHHRCLKDSWSEEEATNRALETWNREPLFHLSSPKNSWGDKRPSLHHDYIDKEDFPLFWKKIPNLTVEVEAKAKELSIFRLLEEIDL